MSELLALENITRKFGGITAVSNLSLTVAEGSVTAAIGPNGAGKSTFFNVITGLYAPTSGDIRFRGVSIGGRGAGDIVRRGIARTFQNIRLFASMTAHENVLVGAHIRMRSRLFDSAFHTSRHRAEERRMHTLASDLLEFLGLTAFASRPANSLPYGDQRRLEIARALACDPKLLLLDEPAAGMTAAEKRALVESIRAIRERGTTILLIEHDMPFVMQLAEMVYVLDQGTTIASGTPDQVRANPRVIDAYLGSGTVA